MKKLIKKERPRFEEVSRKIREALHLEHQQAKYSFTNEDTTATASTRTTANGWYITMFIHHSFWHKEVDEQLRTLIHEHIHACMIPYDQQVDAMFDRLHASEQAAVKEALYRGCEIAVCHLESVLYDLLKSSF